MCYVIGMELLLYDNVAFVDINECDSGPCLNGATCADFVNFYTCDCVAGYTGTDCETSKIVLHYYFNLFL